MSIRSVLCFFSLFLGIAIPQWVSAQPIQIQLKLQELRMQVEEKARAAAAQANDPSQTPAAPTTQPEEASKPEETPEQKEANERERLLTQYDQARRYSAQFEGREYAPEQTEGKALLVLDMIEFGHVYDGTPKGSRYLIGRLHLLNQTDQPLSLSKAGIELELDGQNLKQSEVPENIRGQSFSVGNNQYQTFQEIKRPEETTVEPGKSGWTWIYFHDLEIGSTLPEAKLKVSISGQPHELNLKHQIIGQMGIELNLIGPENSLALIEISGRTNLAALSILAETFDKLLESKVTRVVVVWKKGAQKLDSEISQFLCQYSYYAGRRANWRQDQRFPVLTTGLQEVHLARIPGSRTTYSGRQTIHDDPQTAVAAAIWTALEILSADDLIHEIQQGHPYIRAAALSAGGARLAPDHLGLVLEHLKNPKDPLMQKAAAYALRHFGDPQAVSELSKLVLSQNEQLSSLAVSSLSQSRYQSAREELKNLLARVTGEDRKRLARQLANSPAPDWADLYFENVRNPESDIRVESLQALDRLGHEKFLPLLKECLEADDEALKNLAFSLALNRNEPELEAILEKNVLDRLAAGPPDGNLMNYLRRTKNAAAVPILIEQLKKFKDDSGQRQSLIQILTEIGDDRVARLFVELYKDLTENEQATVLNALSQMQSPQFIEFARAALQSKDNSLVYSAMNNLARTDSVEAEKILIDSFDTLKNNAYIDNLANILTQIGSEEAEAKLREGRTSKNSVKRVASINALRNLERQKPGYRYLAQANYQMRNKKWSAALQYVEMSLATDEKFAPAHAYKGTVLLQLDKADQAEKSFQQAIKFDPETGEAVVGLARVLLRQGKQKEALAAHLKASKHFKDDSDFEAHSAIFLAELVAWGKKQENPTEELQQQIATWETDALQYLSDGFRHGYNDRMVIQNMPQLEILKKHADYANAIQGALPERGADKTDAQKTTGAAVPRRAAPARAAGVRRVLNRTIILPNQGQIQIKVVP